MGTLFLVATPIGNLEDITRRALRILQEVRLIAAEDTRQTRKLLDYYQISTPLTSYHEHNKLQRVENILAALEEGDVALVSDAGTPGLNDPGYELVKAALTAGYRVSPLPGPSAPVAALIASGLPTSSFLYLGYPPRKVVERRRLFQEVLDLPYTLVLLEAPHRLVSSLQDMLATLGARQVVVGREITKLYEEFFRGNLGEAVEYFTNHPPRGEITLVVAGKLTARKRWEETYLWEAIKARLSQGESPSQIAGILAAQSGWARREVYRLITLQQRESNQAGYGELPR